MDSRDKSRRLFLFLEWGIDKDGYFLIKDGYFAMKSCQHTV